MTHKRPHVRPGFLVAEIAIGFFVLSALAVALAVMVHRQNIAAETLNNRRETVRLAEQVLLSLQSDQIPAPAAEDFAITLRRMDTPAAPGGRQWVEVDVKRNGQTATLHGLARTELLGREDGSP